MLSYDITIKEDLVLSNSIRDLRTVTPTLHMQHQPASEKEQARQSVNIPRSLRYVLYFVPDKAATARG